MKADHWEKVASIYEEGIATNVATFETSVPSWEAWNDSHLDHSRFVASSDGKIAGWVALSAVSDRCVYGGVAEVSVYIASDFRGQGIGVLLLNKAIESSEENRIWTLNAAMFPQNIGSARLHEKVGFRRIGSREKIGKLHGEWYDNLLFEKRSEKF